MPEPAPPDGNAGARDLDSMELDVNTSAVDWRELGRRVLSEAMKQSMRELRRRNGSVGSFGASHRNRGGLS
jgi:hypothetical protein